ncbi:MAG: AsmA-like C-terminal domain-containing protein [Candidatus Marinarcus sp.]|uniref:YhdP family protein n=1 Tax=Candidatus Marinarcus sp. TaxID=3100987 RepID=UPI003AFFB427
MDNFSFASIHISKLYIKLDKKLIVEIKEITVPIKSKVKNTQNDIQNNIKHIPTLLKFFQKIDIEKLKISGNEFTISVDQETVFIDNKLINLLAKPTVDGNIITLELYSLFLKENNLLFNGLLKVDLKHNLYDFQGKSFYKEVEANLSVKTLNNALEFEIKSDQTYSNLNFLKDFVTLDQDANEWLYDNITGEIKLNYLKGKLDSNTYLPIVDTLQGSAQVTNAQVHFKKGLDVVKAQEIALSYSHDTLSFNIIAPTYKDIDINGSSVVIHHLSSAKEGNIEINIETKHRLSQAILEILNAYKIKLPLEQIDGSSDSKLSIKLFFYDVDTLRVNGVFLFENSNFKINNFKFLVKNAHVELHDSQVLIKDSAVALDNMLDGTINLEINTKKFTASGEALIHKLEIKKDRDNILKIDNVKTKINANFKEKTTIDLKELFTQIAIEEHGVKFNILNLEKVSFYSELLKKINVTSGDGSILIKNEKDITLYANINKLDFPILNKSGEKITSLSIEGSIQPNKIHISTLDRKVAVTILKNKTTINLTDVDIINEKKEEKSNDNLTLTIKGNNSNIYFNATQKLLADKYTLLIDKKELNLSLHHNLTTLRYIKDKKANIHLNSFKMSDAFVNAMLHRPELFKGGEMSLNAEGNNNYIKGNVEFVDARVKNLAVLNNLIIFINTSPALINPLFAIPAVVGMATNSGFNLNGYRINNGNLDFNYNIKDDLFTINQLKTTGNMADFEAKGLIDLNKNSIQSDVIVIFMKDYTKIVGYIPVINYLFLGEDKRIATAVKISGNLNDPEITTNLAKETANVPLDFVKRIFKLPAKGLELISPKENEQ